MLTGFRGHARAVNLVAMRVDDKPVLTRHLGLTRLDDGVLELEDGTANRANQVIVVIVGGHGLVPRLTVRKVPLVCDARLGEQLQRPVHRSRADAGHALDHQLEQVVHGNVASGGIKLVENHVPLPSVLQPARVHEHGQTFTRKVSRIHAAKRSTAPLPGDVSTTQ